MPAVRINILAYLSRCCVLSARLLAARQTSASTKHLGFVGLLSTAQPLKRASKYCKLHVIPKTTLKSTSSPERKVRKQNQLQELAFLSQWANLAQLVTNYGCFFCEMLLLLCKLLCQPSSILESFDLQTISPEKLVHLLDLASGKPQIRYSLRLHVELVYRPKTLQSLKGFLLEASRFEFNASHLPPLWLLPINLSTCCCCCSFAHVTVFKVGSLRSRFQAQERPTYAVQ